MRRLTKAQKAHNRAEYNRIRRAWQKTDKSLDYKTFKKIVMGRAAGTGETIKEAAVKTANTRLFKTAEEQGKENVLQGLKNEFRGTYDELRKRVGPMKKGETLKDQIEWDKNFQSYILTGHDGTQYIIDISNSPKQASLIQL